MILGPHGIQDNSDDDCADTLSDNSDTLTLWHKPEESDGEDVPPLIPDSSDSEDVPPLIDSSDSDVEPPTKVRRRLYRNTKVNPQVQRRNSEVKAAYMGVSYMF